MHGKRFNLLMTGIGRLWNRTCGLQWSAVHVVTDGPVEEISGSKAVYTVELLYTVNSTSLLELE